MTKVNKMYSRIVLSALFILAVSLFNSCKLTSDGYNYIESYFGEAYNDNFTYKSITKIDSTTADMIFYSEKLEKDITFRRVSTSGFFSTKNTYYSNYNQLEYADEQKDYVIGLVSPYFAEGYEIDYDNDGQFLISVDDDYSYMIYDFDDYISISFNRYNAYTEYLSRIDEETVSVFIKTPENQDNIEKYMKNITVNTGFLAKTMNIYFASDVDAAKKNPGKDTADRKYVITTRNLDRTYTREF